MKRIMLALGPLVWIGCNIDDGSIAVTEQNALGITRLETTRVEHEFELRAYSAQDEAVASVHVRVGRVSDLGNESDGTEILLSASNRQSRIVTRAGEQNTILVDPDSIPEPSVRGLLAVNAVTSVLAREAKIRIIQPTVSLERAYISSWVMSCPSAMLLTAPLAQQCCLHGSDETNLEQMAFIRNTDGSLVYRYRSYACTADNGGTCAGSYCDYGPLGFSRANIISPISGGWAISTWQSPSGIDCWAHSYASDGPGSWPDVRGVRMSANCCLDGSGPCDGDFPTRCDSCGGYIVNGASWDY